MGNARSVSMRLMLEPVTVTASSFTASSRTAAEGAGAVCAESVAAVTANTVKTVSDGRRGREVMGARVGGA